MQQSGDTLNIVKRRQRYITTQLFNNERDWRLSPGDGGDPAQVSEFVLQRELAIEQKARKQLALWQDEMEKLGQLLFSTQEGYLKKLEEEKYKTKYFPVIFISAPHIEDGVSGTFPGIPTPLLYATAVLDRHLRIDEFPSFKVPDVKAVMNPMFYNREFVEQLNDYLHIHKPRLVAISNLSEGHYFALQIAKQVKATSPQTIIIIGGAHEDGTNPEVYRRAAHKVGSDEPFGVRSIHKLRSEIYNLSERQISHMDQLRTLAAEEERNFIDFVAAGDCPYLFMEFMKVVADNLEVSIDKLKKIILQKKEHFSQIEGSGYLFFYDHESQKVEHIRLSGLPIDRNKLPFIFLGHLTHENRFPIFNDKKTAQVMACIGCKYTCSFCFESAEQILYEVPKLQQRSAENVLKELDLLKEQGYEAVFFDDSTFTQNPAILNRLLNLMIERKEPRGEYFEWGCQTTINDANHGMLHRMAEAGCSYIYFGLESVEPGIDKVQKVRQLHAITGGHDWAGRFRKVAEWCHEVGIRVGTSLQFGLNETPEQRQATIDLVAELYTAGYIAKNSVALNINAPYPGTDQWMKLMKYEENNLPDYREKLKRHPGFETSHQFATLPRNVADEIYTLAVEKLGNAIVGVNSPSEKRLK